MGAQVEEAEAEVEAGVGWRRLEGGGLHAGKQMRRCRGWNCSLDGTA